MMNALHILPFNGFRRLARYARSLSGAVLRSAGWRRNALALVDQAVVSAASFSTALILGRFGSREALGVYALALTVLMLLVNVQGELITAPYVLFRQRRDESDVPLYTGSAIVHELVFICLTVAVFSLLAIIAAIGFGPAALLQTAVVLILVAPFWLLRGFVRYMSIANLQFGTALAVDASTALIQLSLMCYLLLSHQLSAPNTYIVMGAACAISCSAWWLARRLPSKIVPARAWRDFRGNWSFSRWALTSQLVGCITPYLLPWILAQARGEADTGTFAACTNLCGIASMFVVGLALALTPQAARTFVTGGKPALTQLLTKTALLFASGVGIFCAIILVCGDFLMTTIYGPSFAGSHWIVSLLALGVMTNSFSIVFGNGLWAVNRPAANLIADVTILLITLLFAALLIPTFGTLGAAAATLTGSAAGAVARAIVFRRVIREVAIPATAT